MDLPIILQGIAIILLAVNGMRLGNRVNDLQELVETQHDINEEQDKVNNQIKAALTHILTEEKKSDALFTVNGDLWRQQNELNATVSKIFKSNAVEPTDEQDGANVPK